MTLVQEASLALAAWLVLAGLAAIGVPGDSQVSALVAFALVVGVLAVALHDSWDWSLSGAKVGSVLLGLGHLGLLWYLVVIAQYGNSTGAWILVVPGFLWSEVFYFIGVIVVVVSNLRAPPPAESVQITEAESLSPELENLVQECVRRLAGRSVTVHRFGKTRWTVQDPASEQSLHFQSVEELLKFEAQRTGGNAVSQETPLK